MKNDLVHGVFNIEHFDKDGNLLGTYEVPNGIVTVGLNYLLDAGFNGGSAVSTWYMGLIDNAGFSSLNNADTMGSHTGWAESVAYSEAGRPEWEVEAAASRQVTNSTNTTDFSINASATLYGIFITSSNTKSGTTGTLWSTAAFSSTVSTSNGDTIKVTYTVSG